MNITLVNQVIDNINILFSFLSFFIALSQLMVKEKNWFNYIVIVIYTSFGFLNLEFAFFMDGTLFRYPDLFGISWPFHYFIMPAAYLYVKMLVNHEFKPGKKHLAFFLPGVVQFIILVPVVYIKGPLEKAQLISGSYPMGGSAFFYYSFMCIMIFKILFVLLTLYDIRFMLTREGFRKSTPIRIVAIVFLVLVVGFLVSIIAIVSGNKLLLRLDTLILNVVVFAPFFLGYRYPNFLYNLHVEVSIEKYKQSQVHGLNVDAVINRLKEILEIERIFIKPELNINSMSEKLDVSSHQLSEIINRNMGVNFRTLINRYRIDEAKNLLIQKPDDTILQIAYAVGFNSKTSFNNTFASFVSMTPSEYRKMNLLN